jgi:hypothetical protein
VATNDQGDRLKEAFRDALRLLFAGQAEAGLAQYSDGLRRARNLLSVPAGLHVRLLEQAGRTSEADAVRRLALEGGADLALKAGSIGAEPAEAALEYERLIEAGTVNSRMIHEYLIVLAKLGRAGDIAAMLDPERLLRQVKIDPPSAAGAPGTVAAAIGDVLLEEESRGTYYQAKQSIRSMTTIRYLEKLEHPSMIALVGALRDESERYLADWRNSEHPLAGLVPAEFEISAWGLISRGEGYNTPHIHHRGWATGVYYSTGLPDEGEGGTLRIGWSEELGGAARGLPDVTIRPEPGLLVLMPSFYMHWTVPLGRPGLRISTAFDLSRMSAQ